MQSNLLRILLVLSLSALCGCPGTDAPNFVWNPKLYATDSKTQLVFRFDESNNLEEIPTSDQKFDSMICMDKSEPRKALEGANALINACETWKSGAALREALATVERLQKEVDNVEISE